MNVLLINGSPHRNGCTFTALSEIAGEVEKQGIETRIFHIGTKAIRGCVACKQCGADGHCSYSNDVVNECIDLMQQADSIIVGSPVYYASPNGALLALLDRAFYASGERFAYKPAAAIVSCRRGGAATAFDVLNKYFTISHMPVVSSQYWNEVHGNTPEEVRQDLEGLQNPETERPSPPPPFFNSGHFPSITPPLSRNSWEIQKIVPTFASRIFDIII